MKVVAIFDGDDHVDGVFGEGVGIFGLGEYSGAVADDIDDLLHGELVSEMSPDVIAKAFEVSHLGIGLKQKDLSMILML